MLGLSVPNNRKAAKILKKHNLLNEVDYMQFRNSDYFPYLTFTGNTFITTSYAMYAITIEELELLLVLPQQMWLDQNFIKEYLAHAKTQT